MKRLPVLMTALFAACLNLPPIAANAAEMTFQLINDTERPLSLKLFSRAESHQEWPAKNKFYTVRPDAAVQQLKIKCEEGEQICWGAWMKVENVSGEVGASGRRDTRTTKYLYGAGERGIDACTRCCHICKDGALTPVSKLGDPDQTAR